MITYFTIPKAFEARAAVIQHNAIRSWGATTPDAEILLYGNDAGVAEAAATTGAVHLAEIMRNASGTPRLDGVFADAQRRARHDVLCFVNADIVMRSDLSPSIAVVAAERRPFLVVGETWDTAVDGELAGPAEFDALTLRPGRKRGAGALDWFVFSRGLYDDLPPFVVGRVGYDNWLVWRARSLGVLVVDATPSVHAVHQSHDYGHVRGGFEATRLGSDEGRANLDLVGEKSRLYTRFDATHVLRRGHLRRNWGSILRTKENARKVWYKTRHALGASG